MQQHKQVLTNLIGNGVYDNVTPLPKDIQGWASQSEVFEAVIREWKPKLIIEVGTWKGASAIHMATLCKQNNLDTLILCIDTFLGSVEHWVNTPDGAPALNLKNGRPTIYEQFLSNVIHEQLTDVILPFTIDSINGGLALHQLGIKADVIYIDAGHEYESVKADLKTYKEVVRPGGCIVGDDWFHGPIRQAVAEVLGDVITLSNDKFLWINK